MSQYKAAQHTLEGILLILETQSLAQSVTFNRPSIND